MRSSYRGPCVPIHDGPDAGGVESRNTRVTIPGSGAGAPVFDGTILSLDLDLFPRRWWH